MLAISKGFTFLSTQPTFQKKALLEWNYPMNYLLHVGIMLTIIKVLIILFLLVRLGNILTISKINQ